MVCVNENVAIAIATSPTVPLGRLHLRSFQWKVILQIRRGRNSASTVPTFDASPLVAHRLRVVPFCMPVYKLAYGNDVSFAEVGMVIRADSQ